MTSFNNDQLFRATVLLENDITTMQTMMVQMTQRLTVLQNELYAMQSMMEPVRPQEQNAFTYAHPTPNDINLAMGAGYNKDIYARPYNEPVTVISKNIPGCPQSQPSRLFGNNAQGKIGMSKYAELFRLCMNKLGIQSDIEADRFMNDVAVRIFGPNSIGIFKHCQIVSEQMLNLDLNKEWYDWFMGHTMAFFDNSEYDGVFCQFAAPRYGAEEHQMDATDIFVMQPLTALDLFNPIQIRNLYAQGIKRVGDLYDYSEAELVALPGIGRHTLLKILKLVWHNERLHMIALKPAETRKILDFEVEFCANYGIAKRGCDRVIIYTESGFGADRIPDVILAKRLRRFMRGVEDNAPVIFVKQ